MTQQTASALIEQNLAAIYGYAFSKLYDKSQAEDLTSEIVLEILRSAKNLRNEKAFWGFAWKVAENTFRKFIRRQELIAQSVSLDQENICGFLTAAEIDDTEDAQEEIYRLRRELSLLGKRHREICVAYYVYNESCSSIATKYQISVETVKQHLFSARKQLKEGMKMERKLGEKSYDPGVFRVNFWGDGNRYHDICKKKLPGAILLTAYRQPLTMSELSMEVGVAMPYLEEEVEILEAAGLLIRKGKKLATNIVIITDEYEKEFAKVTKECYPHVAEQIFTSVKAVLPQIRQLDFQGNDYDNNRLLFAVLNMVFFEGYRRADEKSTYGTPLKLPLGCNGWVFGHDNDYANCHFRGIAGMANNTADTAWISSVNYTVTLQAQHFVHNSFLKKIEVMCDAVLEKDADPGNETLPDLIRGGFITSQNGKLSANFPVFTESVLKSLQAMLQPQTEIVADCMIDISDRAEEVLSKTVPSWLKSQCGAIAKIHHRMNVMAFLMEHLIESKQLTVPNQKVPLCTYGVRKQ